MRWPRYPSDTTDVERFLPELLLPGRKRHIAVYTRGLLLFVMVTSASFHDSVAVRETLLSLRLLHPDLVIVWADSIYACSLSPAGRSPSSS
ncbi:transposase [Streptomyces venezuelae]|uniref:transposase n=1 Tax=Streptomyces venezuelae TaxID=54571 RepID=UPI00379B7440